MTVAIRAPLVAAATVAVGLALLGLGHPLHSTVAAVIVGAVAGALALASADRPRRILWCACALTAATMALRPFIALPLDPWPVLALAAGVREPLAAALHALVPEPESAILLGIVLGERTSIGRDLREAFAATGTSHLLAISGFNMTLVATAIALALRGRMRPIAVAAVTVIAVSGYSVLVGPAPSVGRAALMSAVGSLALALGRRGAAANALGGALALMLVIDPPAIEDVGLVLSVAATAGLIAFERPLAAGIAFAPAFVRDGIATTIAATVPTLPIVAAVFGRVSVVSPLANLLAVPLFIPIMAFGAATAVVGAISPAVAAPLALAAYVSAAALRVVVETAAAMPVAQVTLPPGPLTGIALAVTAALAVIAARRGARVDLPQVRLPRVRRSHAAIALAVAAAMIAGAFVASRPTGPRLHALDVGQGDAFLIESDGRYALIDGGPDRAVLLRRLGEVLPPWHRRIDVIAITHEHADHGVGLLAVIERYEIGIALEPVGMADVPLTRMWREALERRRIPRRPVGAGTVVRVGDVRLEVLAPGGRRVAVPSLVIRATVGRGSVVFMGDATDDAIADLLLAPDALAARVYVPPHHGADSGHSAQLVAAVRPSAAVISSGAGNRYGHPSPDTLAALTDVPVYRTDRYGTVVLTLHADPIVVRTAKAGLPPDRRGPVPRASAAR